MHSTTQSSSRPTTTTGRPNTRGYASQNIIAISGIYHLILEGRGVSSEVGIACLNRETSVCTITQFAESASYANTFNQIHLLYPFQVIVSSTFIDPPSKLFEIIEPVLEELSSEIVKVSRKTFNDTNGLDFLVRYGIKDSSGVTLSSIINQKYFALSSLSALFR